MRNCTSAATRSNTIDKQIEEDGRRYKRERKFLLLGSGGSGKSTIVKQMQIIHQGGFSDAELTGFRPLIYQNILDSAQSIIVYMRRIGLECVDDGNRVLAEKILDYKLEPLDKLAYFPPEIADAIHHLWKDPIIPEVMDEHSSNFHLTDSALYFLGEVLRIGTPGYVPTEADVLRACPKHQEITETCFNMNQLSIRIIDVSCQRSSREKWIHCFEGVVSIIFCVALSEYDQVLLGERKRNRMAESLELFDSVINSKWFRQTSIILILNKIDIFKQKLPKVPLEQYFPEYTGGANINKAAKYILWRFLKTNHKGARLRIYSHLTRATDTVSIRPVFAAVREAIQQKEYEDMRIL